MTWIWWTVAVLGTLFLLFIIESTYLVIALKWAEDRTIGLNYYGLAPEARDRFKKRLRLHATLLKPILWLNRRSGKLDLSKGRIQYKGVSAPSGTCSLESFQKADAYQARPEDIFVATQMKCGTTWMQHVVFQVLHRGNGDLVETGQAMYAVSPWIEG